MKLLQKIMKGISVGMLTLVVAGGIGSISADAAEISIDYDNKVMYITPNYSDSKEVLVSYPKVTEKRDKYTVKQTAWDVYEAGSNGEVAVDLSQLNPTKDNYIAVRDAYPYPYDDGLETSLVYIPAADILKKGTYDAEKHSIVLYGADGKTEYEGRCLYRTDAGTWKEYSETDDLSMYEYQGTTLYVKTTSNNHGGTLSEYVPQEITAGYRMFTGGTFASKELKVKATKLANAPSISADYGKRTFTVKQGYQYRFNGGKWSDAVTEKSVVLKLGDYAAEDEDGIFEVRKAAVSKNGKYTSPSKIGGMAYRAVLPVGAMLEEGERYGIVSCTVTTEGKGKDVIISNAGADVYEAYVSDKALTSAELANVTTGIKKLAGCIGDGPAKKLTLKGANEGKYVYIRFAGDKNTGAWVSDFELLVRPGTEN